MNISFRPAAAEDYDFLYHLHKAAMRPSVESTYGPWDEDWQQNYFRKHFAPEHLQIIQVEELERSPGAEAGGLHAGGTGGKKIDVGVLYVQERAEELFLAAIEILPEYQRRGIGAAVLRGLAQEADRKNKPVALQVHKTNIAARNLYQRLGFGVTGENDTHYIMAREPKDG